MSIPVSTINNTKVYNLSGSTYPSHPAWLTTRPTRALKRDPSWSRRVELIQDFEFPTASNRLRFSEDGKFLIGVGTYKPQFRVWDLEQKAMKFERHTTAETIDFELLKEDWTLMALLQSNRAIEFHESKGMRYQVKIPKPGRSLCFDSYSSDLLVCTSQDLHLLNLEFGHFKEQFVTNCGVNSCKIGPCHGLYALACENNTVEFWDRRDGSKQASLLLDCEPTTLHYLSELVLAIGNQNGQVSLLDLRASHPFYTRDHHNNFAIKGITNQGEHVISWDRKAVKIWSTSQTLLEQNRVLSLEPNVDINDVVVKSGFIALAVEDSKIASYLIPSLGHAPRWASYLEHLTEEMEEAPDKSSSEIHENYKFVDKTELDTLGLSHLIGTKSLYAYMHGYFMDLRLYEQAKATVNPFAYEEYIAKQKREKLAQERANRITAISQPITVLKKRTKVNSKLAESNEAVIQDKRFQALFEDTSFHIDEESEEWKTLHPNISSSVLQKKKKEWKAVHQKMPPVSRKKKNK